MEVVNSACFILAGPEAFPRSIHAVVIPWVASSAGILSCTMAATTRIEDAQATNALLARTGARYPFEDMWAWQVT